MPNSSETLLIFHFPATMQHNFVLKFHTHSIEEHQHPIEVKTILIIQKLDLVKTEYDFIVRLVETGLGK